MHALNALTLFVNPYFIKNFVTKKSFERKWQVSFKKTKQSIFTDFYQKVSDGENFDRREIEFIEDFSRVILLATRNTAIKFHDSWNELWDTIGLKLLTTKRAKIIELYLGLIEDLKKNRKITCQPALVAAEIIDAFAWLFKIEAERFDYRN